MNGNARIAKILIKLDCNWLSDKQLHTYLIQQERKPRENETRRRTDVEQGRGFRRGTKWSRMDLGGWWSCGAAEMLSAEWKVGKC